MEPTVLATLENPARLAVLASLDLLDTPAEPSFDRLAALAVRLLQVPVALVTLVDGRRQYLKCSAGLGEPWATRREAPLDQGVGARVVASGEPVAWVDAGADPGPASGPVLPAFGLASWLGVPLRVDGQVVGAFCIGDRRARHWSMDQHLTMRDLASAIETKLELRRLTGARMSPDAPTASSRRSRLADAEVHYRALFEGTTELIQRVDIEGRILAANPAWLRALGLEEESAAVGRFLGDFVVPGEAEALGAVHARVMAGLPELRIRTTLLARDGREVLVEGDVLPWIEGDRVVATHAILHDVTEEDRGREALAGALRAERLAREQAAASSRQLREMIERISDGFVALDAEWKYVYVNRRAGELLGRPPESLVGRHIWTEFPEGVGQPFHLAYERAMAEQQPAVLEAHYQPWGRWFENRIYPSPEGLSIYFHDVSERKRAEEALRESESRFRTLAENQADVVFLLDPANLAPVYVNGAYAHLFGHPAEALARDPLAWLGAVHPEDRPRIAASFAALSRGELDEAEYRLVARAGGPEWVRTRVFPIRGADGEVLHLAGITEDITGRKRFEESMRNWNAELEERVALRTAELQDANAELEAYTYSISHDLRAPLRAMRGFAQALVEDYAGRLDDRARDYLGRVVGAAVRMDQMVEDLLAYSRISHSELELRAQPLDEIVAECVRDQAVPAERAGAEIVVAPDLPQVMAHRQTLAQVVHNLLDNALKFVAPGVAPRVRIAARRVDGVVRLWVDDNGIGVAPEHRLRIFRVLERLHGIESYPGTGIGLAIVLRAIERMGGRVGVDALPAGGSRFWIELPAAAPAAGSTEVPHAPRPEEGIREP